MRSVNLYRAATVLLGLACVFAGARAVRAHPARRATRLTTAPADLRALKAQLDAARAEVAKARADVLRRLENSPKYKAALADVEARKEALAKAKAAQDGVDWAEKILRSARRRVIELRQDAVAAPDAATARALDAADAARAAYAKASGRDISTIVLPASDMTRVVIVCDASGHMINTFALLRGELTKWISELNPRNEFNIILFGEPRASALAAKGFVSATPENKRGAYKLIEDASTGGKRDPAAALEAAFRSKPQVICLMAGGDFEDNQAVLDQVRRLNPDGKVKVHTLFFGPDGFMTPSAVDTLWRIADVSGGTFDSLKASRLEEALMEKPAP